MLWLFRRDLTPARAGACSPPTSWCSRCSPRPAVLVDDFERAARQAVYGRARAGRGPAPAYRKSCSRGPDRAYERADPATSTSTAGCGSAAATSTATTRRWCTRRWRAARTRACWSSAAATGSRLREVLRYAGRPLGDRRRTRPGRRAAGAHATPALRRAQRGTPTTIRGCGWSPPTPSTGCGRRADATVRRRRLRPPRPRDHRRAPSCTRRSSTGSRRGPSRRAGGSSVHAGPAGVAPARVLDGGLDAPGGRPAHRAVRASAGPRVPGGPDRRRRSTAAPAPRDWGSCRRPGAGGAALARRAPAAAPRRRRAATGAWRGRTRLSGLPPSTLVHPRRGTDAVRCGSRGTGGYGCAERKRRRTGHMYGRALGRLRRHGA